MARRLVAHASRATLAALAILAIAATPALARPFPPAIELPDGWAPEGITDGPGATAFVGSLGGNRSGQRLALAHVLFNVLTAVTAFVLLQPLTWLVQWLTGQVGLGDNGMIQLALFHSLFNALGVALFWPWQARLAELLQRWLPDRAEPRVLIAELAGQVQARAPVSRARYLDDNALVSADSAAHALVLELRHLARLSLEVICHALFLPVDATPYPLAFLPTMLLIGVGFALGYGAVNVQATAGVADHEQGLAAGLVQSSLQIGGAIVLAAVTAVVSSGYRTAIAVVVGVAVFNVLLALTGVAGE